VQQISFNIELNEILLIILASFFFSYLGNLFSLKGIQYASNPGFSLIIQKSYGALTLFLAPLLFEASITLLKVLGTIVVITFSFLIAYEKGKKILTKDNTWLFYTLGAFFAFSFLGLFAKFILNKSISVYVYFFILATSVAIFNLIHLVKVKNSLNFSRTNTKLGILFLIGFFSFLFNIFLNLAFRDAPNIGYVNSINASSIAALTIVSGFLFKDELNWRKLIGVFGVTLGIILIVI
jgi:drug/metabolite transporter (DMT)-like permease